MAGASIIAETHPTLMFLTADEALGQAQGLWGVNWSTQRSAQVGLDLSKRGELSGR